MKNFRSLLLGSRDMVIIGERALQKGLNLTKMPITFDIVAQISKKDIFWIALICTFRITYTILQNKKRRWLGAAPPPIIFEL